MVKLLSTVILLLVASTSFAQNLNSKNYSDLFNEAKLLIANQKETEAIPVLEELYSRDKDNSNAAYLLGLCYVKSFKKINRAINLLEKASSDYSKFYDRTSLTERNVSEYVYYYLIVAYSLKGDCKQTINTLNQFYKIYSYEDEWYLIDGQKWYRECGKHKWKDEDSLEIQSVPVDSSIYATSTMDTTEAIIENDTQKIQENKQSENLTASKTNDITDNPKPQLSPYKDRLRRVGESGGPKVMTRNVNYTTPTSLFGVQVGAYIRPRFAKDFEKLKNVEVYIDNNGVFRYVIGSFVYRSQAERLLEYVHEVGYHDAFIVDINSNNKFEEEVVRVNNQSIKREIRGKVDFRVQVGAFKEDPPEDLMRIYLQFEDIKENIQSDLTILTLGNYSDYEIAKAYCSNIRESGIPDAFVVAYNEGHKISIEEAKAFLIKQREKELEQVREEDTKKKKKKNRH